MKKDFQFGDDVWARVVQIVQEGMILQIDVTDLLRQIRVEESVDGFGVSSGTLTLTESYREVVRTMHDRLLSEAERLQAERGTI